MAKLMASMAFKPVVEVVFVACSEQEIAAAPAGRVSSSLRLQLELELQLQRSSMVYGPQQRGFSCLIVHWICSAAAGAELFSAAGRVPPLAIAIGPLESAVGIKQLRTTEGPS